MAKLKRHTIELVKEVKGEEIVTETFLTPVFIPFSKVYEAQDLVDDITTNKEKKTEKKIREELIDFVVRLYDNQFTKDDIENKLHAPDGTSILFDQALFVAQGRENDETKKFLAKKR